MMCKRFRWLRSRASEYGIDPAKAMTWGESGGGYWPDWRRLVATPRRWSRRRRSKRSLPIPFQIRPRSETPGSRSVNSSRVGIRREAKPLRRMSSNRTLQPELLPPLLCIHRRGGKPVCRDSAIATTGRVPYHVPRSTVPSAERTTTAQLSDSCRWAATELAFRHAAPIAHQFRVERNYRRKSPSPVFRVSLKR